MQKLFRSLISIVTVFALLCALVGCGGANRQIEQLMKTFQSACNQLDFEALLDCIDPDVAEKVEMAAGIVGLFTNDDSETVLENLANLLSGGEVKDSSFFASIQIEVDKITVDGDSATVSTLLTYRILKDDTVRPATFSCVCKDGQWYISNFKFG